MINLNGLINHPFGTKELTCPSGCSVAIAHLKSLVLKIVAVLLTVKKPGMVMLAQWILIVFM